MEVLNITPRESALASIAEDYKREALAWSITAENAAMWLRELMGDLSGYDKTLFENLDANVMAFLEK